MKLIDCTGFTSSDYPVLEKGMEVECYNGYKGVIHSIDLGVYFFSGDSTRLHIMNIKYIYE